MSEGSMGGLMNLEEDQFSNNNDEVDDFLNQNDGEDQLCLDPNYEQQMQEQQFMQEDQRGDNMGDEGINFENFDHDYAEDLQDPRIGNDVHQNPNQLLSPYNNGMRNDMRQYQDPKDRREDQYAHHEEEKKNPDNIGEMVDAQGWMENPKQDPYNFDEYQNMNMVKQDPNNCDNLILDEEFGNANAFSKMEKTNKPMTKENIFEIKQEDPKEIQGLYDPKMMDDMSPYKKIKEEIKEDKEVRVLEKNDLIDAYSFISRFNGQIV